MPALLWFAAGAAFCWLAERARRGANFEDRLEELEAEAEDRARAGL